MRPWSNIYKIQACSSQIFPSSLPLKERRCGTYWFRHNIFIYFQEWASVETLSKKVYFWLLVSSWVKIRTAETPRSGCFQNTSIFPHLKEKKQKFSLRKLFSRRLCQTYPGKRQHACSSGTYSNSSVFISTRKAIQNVKKVRNLHSLKQNPYHVRTTSGDTTTMP